MKAMSKLRRSLLRVSLLASLLLAVGYMMLWWWFLGPSVGSLQLPEHYNSTGYRVFVYGTLKQPLVRRFITGARVPATPAQLPAFKRHGLTIKPKPDAMVEGLLLEVSAQQMRRLDRYERLGLRYCRFQVQLASGEQVWAYQRFDESSCEKLQQ